MDQLDDALQVLEMRLADQDGGAVSTAHDG
jgi:hypothetical protein